MDFQRWYYFLSIERDFVRTLEFVELANENARTYSNAYAKLLLLAGSEVDVAAKMLCENVRPESKARNISAYRAILTGCFADFHTVEIDIPKYLTARKPWESWGASPPAQPTWWDSYSNVKHRRDKSFSDASQENALSALCGLLVILLYLYRQENLQPYPELLNYGFPAYRVTETSKKLPGV